MQLFTADWIHLGGELRAGQALLVDDAGRIAAAGPQAAVEAAPGAAGAARVALSGRALLPGTITAHSHCFQVLLRGSGDHPQGFRDWVRGHLYPLVERLDERALEAAALLCFSQMARAGITTVGEFHYVHNRKDDYSPLGHALASLVIRAARRVGLRITLLRALYDVQEVRAQGRFVETPAQARESILALASEQAGDPAVRVLPAPHSIHGATAASIRAGAELARELDGPWHIHLAEQKSDARTAQQLHDLPPLLALDALGVLDRRTVLVHGIWLTEAEQALLAEKGGGLVTNPATNMALGDGVAPLTALVRRGVKVALGTDMNAAPCVFQELRLAEMLQRVQALKMGLIPTARGGAPDPRLLFDMATRNGADLLGVQAGALEPGRWADLVALDLSEPALLPASVRGGAALLSGITGSCAAELAVRESWVAGRQVLRAGEVIGLDRAELMEQVRAVAGA